MSDTLKFDEYMSVEQVAAVLGVSVNTVARQFGDRGGVIDLGTKEQMNKRRRRILRISRTTLKKFIDEHQTKRRK